MVSSVPFGNGIARALFRLSSGALILAMAAGVTGCAQYRQRAIGVTPATDCPDYSRGCSKTVWNIAWGLTQIGSDSVTCGNGGLSEVTVRDAPDLFLLTWITLGFVAPKRLEWKCGRPQTEGGTFGSFSDTTGTR
jgi:hypothetical protein